MSIRSVVASLAIVFALSTSLFAQAVRVVILFNGDPDPSIVGGQIVRVSDDAVIAVLPAAAAIHLAGNPAIASVTEDGIMSIPTNHGGGHGGGGGSPPPQPPQSTPWGINARRSLSQAFSFPSEIGSRAGRRRRRCRRPGCVAP